MAYALTTHTEAACADVQSVRGLACANSALTVLQPAAEDPLDLQGLWPITADLANATKRIAATILPIARVLSEDMDAAPASLRQQLLEMRAPARLIYAFDHLGVNIIGVSSQFISTTSHAIATNLRNDPRAYNPGDFTHLLNSVIDGCSSSRLLLIDCQSAWQLLHPLVAQFQINRLRLAQPGSMSSFLRTLGTFTASSSATPSSGDQSSPRRGEWRLVRISGGCCRV